MRSELTPFWRRRKYLKKTVIFPKYGILTDLTPRALADAVETLMDDPESLARYGALSNERARQLCNVEKTMGEIYNVL